MQSFGVELKRSLKYMTPLILILYFFGKQAAAIQMCVGVMSAFDLEKREIAV